MHRLHRSIAARRTRAALSAAAAIALISACAGGPLERSPAAAEEIVSTTSAPVPLSMTVTSNDFVDGGPLDAMFASCGAENQNLNPSLEWEGAPEGTESFVIVVIDPDAGGYVHWVHANLPADMTGVESGTSRDLPGDSGINSSGGGGYMGPCPPTPGHHYEYTVWALDTVMTFDQRPSMGHVLKESAGHIIGSGMIVGVY